MNLEGSTAHNALSSRNQLFGRYLRVENSLIISLLSGHLIQGVKSDWNQTKQGSLFQWEENINLRIAHLTTTPNKLKKWKTTRIKSTYTLAQMRMKSDLTKRFMHTVNQPSVIKISLRFSLGHDLEKKIRVDSLVGSVQEWPLDG